MTALEELKSSARESIEGRQRELGRLLEGHLAAQEDNYVLRAVVSDFLLHTLSYVRTVYQATVAEARNASSVDEVAALWKETHDFYLRLLSFWKGLEAIVSREPPPKIELFNYCGDLIRKLEQASAQAYEFHS
jgi:hypothetical protein